MNNLVVLKNKQATTTSQMVAQKFNKNHQPVITLAVKPLALAMGI